MVFIQNVEKVPSLIYEFYEQLFEVLKKQYPYVKDETSLKNALITIREREGIEGDFSEQYAELDELYRKPTEEEIAEVKRRHEEFAKRIGMAEEDD